VAGVYIFTHSLTGSKYVGSSSQLAVRLNGYIKNKYRSTGLFVPLLYKEGLNNFTLEIIPIAKDFGFRGELVLEQYFLLNGLFNLNRIKVANNPSGANSKPLYMYNRDKSILYYYSLQQKDFITNLNIHFETFQKHLKNNTYYLGKYSFSREFVLTAKVLDISILNLILRLQKDRINFNKNKPINIDRKVIQLTSLTNPNDTHFLYGIRSSLRFMYKEKGLSVSRETLIKYIKLGKPYHGYLCKYV
jgi:hypothetical protein